MWSPNATCRIFSDLTFPAKASSPRLVFEQPRTDKTTLNTQHKHKHKHKHSTRVQARSPRSLFSETMHSSDATTRRPLMLDLW